MTDILGRLYPNSTNTAIGTYTAYQVPPNKGARVRFFYSGVAGVNSTLSMAVNGVTIFTSAALTAGNIVYSSSLVECNTGTAASLTGAADASTAAPGPKEYYLGAGDIVTYTIGTANMTSMNLQVIGTEIDNV